MCGSWQNISNQPTGTLQRLYSHDSFPYACIVNDWQITVGEKETTRLEQEKDTVGQSSKLSSLPWNAVVKEKYSTVLLPTECNGVVGG